MIPLVTEADVAFWIAGPLAVLGALGLVLFRKAVYAALSMAFTMVNLAVLYASLDAMFLTVVQIIVYTGAIMMLFLFVLMLVGVDTPDSVVETLRGQRVAATLAAVGMFALIVFGIGGALVGVPSVGLAAANAQYGGNTQGLAALIFGRYVFAFELTSALLITAAIGAMILGHRSRIHHRPTQRELAERRMDEYASAGVHPGALPNSGVLARHNSIATPALLPDGSVSPESVSAVLAARSEIVDSVTLSAATAKVFDSIEATRIEEADE
ncbi:MAG: NADH-quinone oxidoreductase subunit J [Propionibacteriaceae bacterium]|jgi:NADH-quinone oxidoreductase subunit J|nr:NADH-quinone oxidoreductase subunit J [Propionibacteriaceae bacterium]